MKKSIIAAGAASAVLAAMPVLGVFAENNLTVTDTLRLTIEDTCALDYNTANSNPAHSAPATAKPDGANATTITGGAWGTAGQAGANTFTATVTNGQQYDYFAQTNLNVTCNNMYGYSVTVDASNFKYSNNSGTSYTEEYTGHTWAYNAGSLIATPAEGVRPSSWTIYSNGNNQNLNTSGEGTHNIVATHGAPLPTNGHQFSVSYSAYVATDQPADTYQATAQYTLAQLES